MKTKETKRAIFFIFIIILISALCVLWIFKKSSSGEKYVSIYSQGELLYSFPLLGTEQQLYIETEHGGYNTVIITNGSVYVENASCPDHICMHTGKIPNSLLPIICLPNQLSIEIHSAEQTGTDAITY